MERDDFNFIELKVKTSKKLIPAISNFIKEIALLHNFTKKQAENLKLISEKSCKYIIHYSFEENKNEYYKIFIERKPGKFIIAIEDKGLPFDIVKFEKKYNTKSVLLPYKPYVDEIHFFNLGRKGKRLELVKKLNYKKKTIKEKVIRIKKEKIIQNITIRLMHSDEGIALARCVYRTYGYTYGEFMYHPEIIKEMIKSGLHQSMVAVNENNEIVAHLSLSKLNEKSSVAEIGQAFVNPAYRGKGLFGKMKNKLIEYAKSKNIQGLYSESVTVHPYTQEANHSIGATETGIMLAYIPQNVSFKKIKEKQTHRQAAVLFYLNLKSEKKQRVYIPEKHFKLIQKIYNYGNFSREIEKVYISKKMKQSIKSKINLKLFPEFAFSFLEVMKYGFDFQSSVQSHLKELCYHEIKSIFIDLPLTNPLSPVFCNEIEELGFFFAGIIPDLIHGDVIRLQYLNNVVVDKDNVILVSDFARTLFDYVLKAQN